MTWRATSLFSQSCTANDEQVDDVPSQVLPTVGSDLVSALQNLHVAVTVYIVGGSLVLNLLFTIRVKTDRLVQESPVKTRPGVSKQLRTHQAKSTASRMGILNITS